MSKADAILRQIEAARVAMLEMEAQLAEAKGESSDKLKAAAIDLTLDQQMEKAVKEHDALLTIPRKHRPLNRARVRLIRVESDSSTDSDVSTDHDDDDDYRGIRLPKERKAIQISTDDTDTDTDDIMTRCQTPPSEDDDSDVQPESTLDEKSAALRNALVERFKELTLRHAAEHSYVISDHEMNECMSLVRLAAKYNNDSEILKFFVDTYSNSTYAEWNKLICRRKKAHRGILGAMVHFLNEAWSFAVNNTSSSLALTRLPPSGVSSNLGLTGHMANSTKSIVDRYKKQVGKKDVVLYMDDETKRKKKRVIDLTEDTTLVIQTPGRLYLVTVAQCLTEIGLIAGSLGRNAVVNADEYFVSYSKIHSLITAYAFEESAEFTGLPLPVVIAEPAVVLSCQSSSEAANVIVARPTKRKADVPAATNVAVKKQKPDVHEFFCLAHMTDVMYRDNLCAKCYSDCIKQAIAARTSLPVPLRAGAVIGSLAVSLG